VAVVTKDAITIEPPMQPNPTDAHLEDGVSWMPVSAPDEEDLGTA